MGASASMMPSQIDRETFSRLVGGLSVDAVFDKHSVNGFISREKLIELSSRSVFSSYDRALDRYGRKNQDRVMAINRYLSGKGIDALSAEMISGGNHIPNMYDSINRARCVLIFLTSSYASKITINNNSATSTDHCQLEYNHILRNKRDEHVIFVIMEDVLLKKDSVHLPAVIKESMTHSVKINFSDDSSFEGKCEELFKMIVNCTSLCFPESSSGSRGGDRGMESRGLIGGERGGERGSGGDVRVTDRGQERGTERGGDRGGDRGVRGGSSEAEVVSHLRDVAAPQTREEMQLYQWLGRATKISESRRVVYFASFIRSGSTSVNKLAKQMMTAPRYLQAMGLNDFDADEVALAVAELGLGSLPVADFSAATSVDSAIYAVKKSLAAPLDHKIAANALVCVARIAGSSREAPVTMGRSGFCDSVHKILLTHIESAVVVEQACKAIENIAVNVANMERFGAIGMCDLLSRTTARHLANGVVLEGLCCVIALLATNSSNREKFGISGMCELITRALPGHLHNEANAEQACRALSSLSMLGEGIIDGVLQAASAPVNLNDNVWKLGQTNASQLMVQCLRNHPNNASLALNGLMTITYLATNDENRNKLSEPGVAEAMMTAAVRHRDDPAISEQTCRAVSSIIYGNAFNSKRLGEGGACEFVRNSLIKFKEHPSVVRHACIAIANLAAGNSCNQAKFDGLKVIVTGVISNPAFGDDVKSDAKVALSKLR